MTSEGEDDSGLPGSRGPAHGRTRYLGETESSELGRAREHMGDMS